MATFYSFIDVFLTNTHTARRNITRLTVLVSDGQLGGQYVWAQYTGSAARLSGSHSWLHRSPTM